MSGKKTGISDERSRSVLSIILNEDSLPFSSSGISSRSLILTSRINEPAGESVFINETKVNNQRAAEYDARNAANAYAASEQNAANAAYTEAVNERAVNAYNAKREDAENKRTNDLNLFTARYGARSLDSNKKELKSINEKLKKLNSKKKLTDAEKKEKNTLLLKQEAVSNVIKEQKDKKK